MRKIPNITRSPTDEFPRQTLNSHPLSPHTILTVCNSQFNSQRLFSAEPFLCLPLLTYPNIYWYITPVFEGAGSLADRLFRFHRHMAWTCATSNCAEGAATLKPSLPSNCLLGDMRWKLSVLLVQIKAEGSSHFSHVTVNSIFRGHNAKCHAVSRMEWKVKTLWCKS